jgi:hypothetical protein
VTGGVRRRRGAQRVERADLVERVVVASSVWPVPHGSRRSRRELEAIGVTSLALDALNDHRRGQLDHPLGPDHLIALEVAVRGGTRSKKMLTRKVPTSSKRRTSPRRHIRLDGAECCSPTSAALSLTRNCRIAALACFLAAFHLRHADGGTAGHPRAGRRATGPLSSAAVGVSAATLSAASGPVTRTSVATGLVAAVLIGTPPS